MSIENWIGTPTTTLDHDPSNCTQTNKTKSVKIYDFYRRKMNKNM
jgi:hypothetical protein